jgi:hypothetical protein
MCRPLPQRAFPVPPPTPTPPGKRSLAHFFWVFFLTSSAIVGSAEGRPQIPEFPFRVLIMGRANAGKTSILQRVCETTESAIIYRGGKEVRGSTICLRV